MSSRKTTVNITLIFSSLTNTELEPHHPVLFQHVCPFHFIQSLICMLHESLAHIDILTSCFVLQKTNNSKRLTSNGRHQGGQWSESGVPAGENPWGSQSQEQRWATINSYSGKLWIILNRAQLCRPHGDQNKTGKLGLEGETEAAVCGETGGRKMSEEQKSESELWEELPTPERWRRTLEGGEATRGAGTQQLLLEKTETMQAGNWNGITCEIKLHLICISC